MEQIILYKQAIQRDNIITSRSQYQSSGFMYKVKTISNINYVLDIDVELLEGDKAFVYGEYINKVNAIPRTYIITSKYINQIELIGTGADLKIGVLFWTANVKYTLKINKFTFEKRSNKPISLSKPHPIKLTSKTIYNISIIIHCCDEVDKLNNILYTINNSYIPNLQITVYIYDYGQKKNLYKFNQLNIKYIHLKKYSYIDTLKILFDEMNKLKYDYYLYISINDIFNINFIYGAFTAVQDHSFVGFNNKQGNAMLYRNTNEFPSSFIVTLKKFNELNTFIQRQQENKSLAHITNSYEHLNDIYISQVVELENYKLYMIHG